MEDVLLLGDSEITTDSFFHRNDSSMVNKTKILVVEDNLLNQKVIRIFLEDMGYQVDIAPDGQQALALFNERNSQYGAILMDIGLPDIDGCKVSETIRSLEYGQQIPIVALTASGEYFKEKCLAAGMNFYLTKPIMVDDLKVLLDTIIGKSNNGRAFLDNQEF